jgi:acyl dehydratase
MSPFKEKVLIKQEDIVLFAEAVGDPNPIHQDNEVARKMGLEGAIAHGMFMHSYLMRRLDEWMRIEKSQNGTRWEILSTRCRFHEPALIGKTFESILELSNESAESPEAPIQLTSKMSMTFADEEGNKLTHIVAQLKKI